MTNSKNIIKYDLEERTFKFAQNCRQLIPLLPKTITNTEDSKQLIRSSGSVAANYIEANESLSRKDFMMRIKICRKEAKESSLWLKLLEDFDKPNLIKNKFLLIQESIELTKIFGSILEKCK